MSDTRMKCPTCAAQDKKSSVYVGMTFSTLMGGGADYYDEDGVFHRAPDPNWHTTSYQCSEGHAFRVRRREGFADEVSANE